MVISNFTTAELDYFRDACNFVGNEELVFELRSCGQSLEEIAEVLNLSVEGIKKISRKVNSKIIRVSGGKEYDKGRGYHLLEKPL